MALFSEIFTEMELNKGELYLNDCLDEIVLALKFQRVCGCHFNGTFVG